MSLYADKTANRSGNNKALTLDQLDQLREKLIIKLRNEAQGALEDIKGNAAQVGAAIRDLIDKTMPQLSHQEARAVQGDLMNDIYGWGPISDLMLDESVTDIWIYRWHYIEYEKDGRISVWPRMFLGAEHLRRMAVRMAASVGRKVDEGHPLEDCRLPGGERVTIVLDPVSLGGVTVTIRRFGKFYELEDLAAKNMYPRDMIPVFEEIVWSRKNFLIAGGFGCGKNTLMNAMVARVKQGERLLLIEDPAESNLLYAVMYGPPDLRKRLPKAIWHLEPRHSNIEGAGEVSIDQIYRSALKMKPTRIMVAEIIDWKTAYYSLAAMNVGQPGSPGTLHATGCQNGLQKASDYLLSYPGGAYANPGARANLIAGVDLVIYLQQNDGHRYCQEIAEVRQASRGEFPVAVPVYLDDGSGLRRVNNRE